MPCDRTFGVIKRAVRKYDRIYSPEQYKTIICNAKNMWPKYENVEVQNQDILELVAIILQKVPYKHRKCRGKVCH